MGVNVLIVFMGIVVFALAVWIFKLFAVKINFFTTGLDSKFKFSEISLLWKLGKANKLEDPLSLFISEKTLSVCISSVLEEAKRNGTENSIETQAFLEKLYKFRTKLELSADNKRGLESSQALTTGQKLRIVLKGKGLFASSIFNNGTEMAITMPIQSGKYMLRSEDWVGKTVSVYLWRKGDAGYVFDTQVRRAGIFMGNSVLFLAHSNNLLRMQKRRSIRVECRVKAQLYIIQEKITDFNKVEMAPGYKCLIEDISPEGALIRIGGKGVTNVQIKLQFTINGGLIIMYGIVRSVEYNATNNQSRLHIECLHLEPSMKSAIMNFMYTIIPEDEKNEAEAITELQKEEEVSDGDVTSEEKNGLSIDVPTEIYEKSLKAWKENYTDMDLS